MVSSLFLFPGLSLKFSVHTIHPLCCPQYEGGLGPASKRGWSLIHSRDLILSFALLEFSQKRPNKPCLTGGGIRATPSKLQNKGLWVALGNSMLHSDSGLVWWPPAVNIWNPFPTWKSHPDRTAIPIIGPTDVAKRAWGSPEGREGTGSLPDCPIRGVNLSWGHWLNRGDQKIF